MQHKNEIGLQEIQLEAPGDFLSELLGVVEAAVIPLDGDVPESAWTHSGPAIPF